MQELQTKVQTLNSREVAKMMKKRHDHLVRDIQKYSEYLADPNFGVSDFFIKSAYKDGTGRTLICYQITKKGCELIAHKMTGEKGTQFSALYINRFHEMEHQLRKPRYTQQHIDAPYTYKDKYWQCKQVVTLMDIEQLTGCGRHNVLYYIKHEGSFQSGEDYYFLEGADLREFKRQNGYNKYANSLWLLTESGCRKLSKGFREIKGKLPSFEYNVGVELTSLKTIKYAFDNTKRDLESLEKFLELLRMPMTKGCIEKGQKLVKPFYHDLIKSMEVLLNIQIDNELQVLVY